jgi:hypothetical protein
MLAQCCSNSKGVPRNGLSCLRDNSTRQESVSHGILLRHKLRRDPILNLRVFTDTLVPAMAHPEIFMSHIHASRNLITA